MKYLGQCRRFIGTRVHIFILGRHLGFVIVEGRAGENDKMQLFAKFQKII